jgi:hypothetical protein
MPVPLDWSPQLRAYVEKWKHNSRAEEYIGDQPFPRFVLTEQAASWDGFLLWLSELQGSWCFRGQREADWLLHTSLDRAVRREQSSPTSSSLWHLNRDVEARTILFRFQQQAHLYLKHLPAADDLSSWFGLMQHHGAPTPFLDWTKSPYAAMYFALEEKPQEEKRSAVWAIDLDWLENTGRELLKAGTETLVANEPRTRAERINSLLGQSLLGKNVEVVVINIAPLKTNERTAAQQGMFLTRLFPLASFSQTLMSMMFCSAIPDHPVVRKLEVVGTLRCDFLKRLRVMNIHRASLFPGLDGFGQSLRLDLELKDTDEAL